MQIEERLRRIHNAVDRYNDNYFKEMSKGKMTAADRIMFDVIHRNFTHTLIDMRMKHNLSMNDIEDAIVSVTANMVSLFIRSALSMDMGPVALAVAGRIIRKIDDTLYEAIASNFYNTGEGPTEGDTIQ